MSPTMKVLGWVFIAGNLGYCIFHAVNGDIFWAVAHGLVVLGIGAALVNQ